MSVVKLLELVGGLRALVAREPRARIGIIVSSHTAAQWMGRALAHVLHEDGVVWRGMRGTLTWPGGAIAHLASIVQPDRLRGHRWDLAYLSSAAAQAVPEGVLEDAREIIIGALRHNHLALLLCTEVSTEAEFLASFREEAGADHRR